MQDTKNLKRKVKAIQQRLKSGKGTEYDLEYWKRELDKLCDKILDRDRNKAKNLKQFKKAN